MKNIDCLNSFEISEVFGGKQVCRTENRQVCNTADGVCRIDPVQVCHYEPDPPPPPPPPVCRQEVRQVCENGQCRDTTVTVCS